MGVTTVEAAYKVFICPRGNLLYCRPYFINDPSLKPHFDCRAMSLQCLMPYALRLPSLCSLEFNFFNQELKSIDVIHAFLLPSYHMQLESS